MQMFDLMIFDLDGTLVDTSADIIAAVNFTRHALDLPIMDDKEIKKVKRRNATSTIGVISIRKPTRLALILDISDPIYRFQESV